MEIFDAHENTLCNYFRIPCSSYLYINIIYIYIYVFKTRKFMHTLYTCTPLVYYVHYSLCCIKIYRYIILRAHLLKEGEKGQSFFEAYRGRSAVGGGSGGAMCYTRTRT